MKTRILAGAIIAGVAVAVWWMIALVLGTFGIDIPPTPLHALLGLISLAFGVCLSILHLMIGFYVWKDARRRDDLLLGIPAWVWGLMGLASGILGLGVHWLANCSRFVKDQTVGANKKS